MGRKRPFVNASPQAAVKGLLPALLPPAQSREQLPQLVDDDQVVCQHTAHSWSDEGVTAQCNKAKIPWTASTGLL